MSPLGGNTLCVLVVLDLGRSLSIIPELSKLVTAGFTSRPVHHLTTRRTTSIYSPEGTTCEHRAILVINRVSGPGILLDAVHRSVGSLGETEGERDPCRLLVLFPRWRCDIVHVRPSPTRSGLHDW